MSAINFVVRDVAGNISRGSVSGEGAPSSVALGAGAELSLNLSQGQILSYVQNGQSLQITLLDGRVITVEGFFGPSGAIENQLFISSDGYLTEVNLTQGAGNDFYANYIPDDGVGKFALNDDLYFMRSSDVILADAAVVDDGVGMLALAGLPAALGWGGAAAAAGAAVLVGGGGSDGSGPAAPEVVITEGTVESNEHVVNEEGHAAGVGIGGEGTPGGSVAVTIGDVTETTTVAEDGTWEVVFDPADVAEGEYTTDVAVTITNDGGEASVTHTLVVDTVIGASMSEVGGADSVVNAAEYGDGITLTGPVSGADAVVVTIGGVAYDATISEGSWSLDVDPSVLGEGEYSTEVIITATDAAGNSSTATATVEVDTLIGVTADAGWRRRWYRQCG